MRRARGLAALLLAIVGASRAEAQRSGDADGSSVRIVRVSAPDARGGEWTWQVVTEPAVRLLGPRAGRIDPASGAPVLVTVQNLSPLEAGPQQVGTVIFSRDAEVVRTPVFIDVPARRAVELVALTALVVAEPGEPAEVRFTLHNAGNAPDSIVLALDTRWDATIAGPRTFTLAAGAVAPIRLVVRPPAALAAGGTIVALRAVGRGASAEARTTIEVGATRPRGAGGALHVTTSLAHLTGPAGLARTVGSVAIAGAIMPGLDVTGALITPLGAGDALLARGASMVGLPLMGSQLRLATARTALDVGRVALRLPELAGRGIGGDGVALLARVGGDVALAVVRDPLGGPSQEAFTWTDRFGPVALDAAAVRLRADRIGVSSPRALDALALGVRLDAGAGATIGLEVADRRSREGRELGLAAELAWDGRRGHARMRAQHAPGGTSALALAHETLNLETLLRLDDRWTVATHGWFAADGKEAEGRINSVGGAFNPARRIGRQGDLGLVIAAAGFSSTRAGVRQATLDAEAGLRAAGAIGALRWDLEGVHGAQERSTRSRAFQSSERTDRTTLRSGLAVGSRAGLLGLRGSYASATPAQASELALELQATDLRPIRGLRWLTLDGALQRAYLGRAGMDHARLALRLALPGEVAVHLGLERESWRGAQQLPSRTSVAFRVARAATFAGADRWRARTGIVFEDLDDDGVKDANEPVVRGVVLRAGATTVTSDAAGRFRLAVDAPAPEVDVRTLRADQRPGARGDRWAVAVRTVGRLEVTVRRAVPLRTAAANTVPATLVVTARAASGAEWRATVGRDGIARFDALPVGAYTVTAAATDAAITLRLDEVAVRVERGSGLPGAVVRRLELVERDRPVRLQTGGSLGVGGLAGDESRPLRRERQEHQ